MTSTSKTLSLVLGSGGARGLAHIGVIKWLDDNGYTIRAISGASMGALIGGIYACGKLDSYQRWVTSLEKLDVIRLLDFSFSRDGLFKGERIIGTLKELIGDSRIEELPISFTAVATELYSGKETWISSGSLFDAIRASIAVPSLVTPHKIGGKFFIDGAVSNPLPIAPTLNDSTDMTVAVNVSGKYVANGSPPAAPVEVKNGNHYRQAISLFIDNMQRMIQNNQGKEPAEADKITLLDVMTRAMDTMQQTITRFHLATYAPDVVIDIPKNCCGFYEFHRAAEVIEVGYRRAEQLMGSAKA